MRHVAYPTGVRLRGREIGALDGSEFEEVLDVLVRGGGVVQIREYPAENKGDG